MAPPAPTSHQQEQNKAPVQVNPASEEAQELRQTGMHPVAVDEETARQEKHPVEDAPREIEKKGGDDRERNRPATEKEEEAKERDIKQTDQVGSGEEVAGLTQLAAEKASAAAAQAKEAAVGAAATAATATKETARKVILLVFLYTIFIFL
jgi:hypothetical protein